MTQVPRSYQIWISQNKTDKFYQIQKSLYAINPMDNNTFYKHASTILIYSQRKHGISNTMPTTK